MTEAKINLAEKLTLIDEHWKPKIVADLNDYELKVVTVFGEFTARASSAERRARVGVSGGASPEFGPQLTPRRVHNPDDCQCVRPAMSVHPPATCSSHRGNLRPLNP